jgi:hypothetical protein
MASYFERLVDFVGAHPQLSFLAVFLLVARFNQFERN